MPKDTANEQFERMFDLPNPGLRAYFGRVVKGQPDVYETPFAKGESTQALLKHWKVHLESIHDQWPSLFELENDQAEKVGPMSVMQPLKKRLPDIASYYDGILLPSQPVNSSAVKAVVSEFSGIRGLKLRAADKTVQRMKLSTNSGSPWFTKRRGVVQDTLPCHVWQDGSWTYQSLDDQEWLAAAVLGWRGQEGGPNKEDVKQRVVWMFPFAVNIEELRVYQPLIEGAQKKRLVPAWISNDEVDLRVTNLMDSKGKDDLVVCTDFSAFDQHINPTLQAVANTILTALLSPGESSRSWLNEVFPVKYNIPIAYNWNTVRTGEHGMASGSGGTNCDETLLHRALQYEAAILDGQRLNINSQCLGDDGMLSYPGITVESVVKHYSSHGLEMNPSKQTASTDYCVYLRRWHHKDYRENGVCVGVYPTTRALGRLRYLERFMDPDIWNERAVALRQLSILENVKWHPLKEEFVEFCMERDKYRLGLDIPGFLSDIESIAKEFTDNMPDFIGYNRANMDAEHGINEWWIVKYLKSKA